MEGGVINPIYYSEYGELLMLDMRDSSMAEYYLKKATYMRKGDARSYASLSYFAERSNDLRCAYKAARFAACLGS